MGGGPERNGEDGGQLFLREEAPWVLGISGAAVLRL